MGKRVLTDKAVGALKAAEPGRRYVISDAIVPGLGVRVTDRGHKTFVLGARFPGSKHFTRIELAEVGAVLLADAREKAREWLQLIKQGKDPRGEELRRQREQARRAAITFEAVAEDFFAQKLSQERKGKEVERDIRREFFPRWCKRPITEIDRHDVRSIIKGIVARGAPYQAHNALGYVRRLFDWAIEQGAYGIEVSRCAGLKPKTIIGKKHARKRILSEDEIRAFWRAAFRLPYPYGPTLRLLLCLGQRHNEVAKASRTEFHPELMALIRQHHATDQQINWCSVPVDWKVWAIGEERFKSDAPHMVPLPDAACEILASLPVFKGIHLLSTTLGEMPTPVSSKMKDRLDARMLRYLKAMARLRGENPSEVTLKPWVIHDLRRTVRTGLAAERVQDHVAEMVIGHGRKGIQRVYDQHRYLAEIREALEKWVARLGRVINPPKEIAENVFRLRA